MKDSTEKYFKELSIRLPDKESVLSEITRLNIELNLPKGTEHFLSDLHGEADAFQYVIRSASGVIRHKIDILFSDELDEGERAALAALIYYPNEMLKEMKSANKEKSAELDATVRRLVKILQLVGEKYTKQRISKELVEEYPSLYRVFDRLLWGEHGSCGELREDIIVRTFSRVNELHTLINALCKAIRALVIDRLHIVGDIFDRGPRPDMIIDELMQGGSVDIEWGNHDILWMGAAAGSEVCIATVLNNSITYKNLDVIEFGYGISLRPLALFAEEEYGNTAIEAFLPKGELGGDKFGQGDNALVARMHKAIAIIQFKLECEIITRNPDFDMSDRLILPTLDKNGNVIINGKGYKLRDNDFPTVYLSNPEKLTEGERRVIDYLVEAFRGSERLQRHIKFLYKNGSMYKICNNNILFHGCVPMDSDGEFLRLAAAGGAHGMTLMNFCDRRAREGYFSLDKGEKRRGEDFLWFLWCGKNSPLSAREKITTFERLLIEDSETHREPKNHYYKVWEDESLAEKILHEFGLSGDGARIVNGHIPVIRGENPIKANGKVIVIDGGFCRAYHNTTGIAGYTLIYNADGMKLFAHKAFEGKEQMLACGKSQTQGTLTVFARKEKIKIRECDRGAEIREELCDLLELLEKYQSGSKL